MTWLTSLFTLCGGMIVAVGAFLGVRMTVRHNARVAAREEWWKRFLWASELARAEDREIRILGLRVMVGLAESPHATEEDLRLLDPFHERLLREEERGYA